MAYITPNTDVVILKGVPLDSEYNHTGYFASEAAQYAAMYTYKKWEFAAQTYQRAGLNRIRLGRKADDFYDCNYLMFRNTAYGSKWFYAFLDKVEYVNDSTTIIEYTIDVMQTWNFDYVVEPSFVEREHSATDAVGDNTVPENFELGEKVVYLPTEYKATRYLACVITTKRLCKAPVSFTPLIDGLPIDFDESLEYHLQPQGDTTQAISGVPNGCYMYMGIPVAKEDVDNYWSTYYTSYDMQDYRVYNTPGGTVNTQYTSSYPLTLSMLLYCVRTVANLSLDDIVGIYIYPADLSLKTYMNTAQTYYGYAYGTAISENAITVARPINFASPDTSVAYTPKNNKLFTYPYIDIKVSNNQGVERIYQFERFDSTVGYKFAWVGIQSNSTMTMYPRAYNDDGSSFNEGVSLSTEIPVPIRSSAYDTWLETQKYGAGMGLLGNALHAAGAIGLGIASGNPAPIVGGATSLVSSVGGLIANVADMKNTPDQVSGNVTNGSLHVATKRLGFRVSTRTIKAEYAKIIDDYFTMFGYATHRVKVPNIRSSTSPRRQYWNYIKTRGCILHPASGKGLPADDEKKIAQIYDNGITFWTGLNNVGNYSLTNSIVNP